MKSSLRTEEAGYGSVPQLFDSITLSHNYSQFSEALALGTPKLLASTFSLVTDNTKTKI